MARNDTALSARETTFDPSEFIVSKTDINGRITYANRVFERVSGYSEQELLGKAHSMIRHTSMPRCVFRMLWTRIQSGNEIFAYVVNRCKNGDYYWVLAHVTPSFDEADRIIGFHSNRRVPDRAAVTLISDLYRQLKGEEDRQSNKDEGTLVGIAALERIIAARETTYDEFIFSTFRGKAA